MVQATTSKRLESIAEELPQTDEFVGETLTIFTPEAVVIEGNEESAGSVRGALKNRNELLHTSYGMEVKVQEVQEDEIAELLRSAQMAGVSAADLLCYSAETTVSLWAEGLLQDLNALPFFSPADACYDAKKATVLQVGNGRGLYLLPDPSAQGYEHTYVVFYDRELVRKAGLETPEKEVIAGNWTLETFRRYSEAVAASVMGKGSYDLDNDIFGFTSRDNSELLPYLLWSGTDGALFAKNAGGVIDFAYDADTLSDRMDPLRAVYNSASRYPRSGGDAGGAFAGGRIGFLFAELEEIKNFYDNAERDYGLLPLPKRDAAQTGYRCPIAVVGNVLSVPVQVNGASRSGIGLTAFCAAGGALLQEAQIETYITLYSLDNDQTCMLETIMEAAVFDFGWVYGTQERSVRKLSSGLLSDVLVNGSRVSSVLNNNLDSFRAYANEMFS